MNDEKILILVADPEDRIHHLFDELAKKNSLYEIFHAKTSDEATALFLQHHIQVAFLDLYLYPIHGLEILKKIKSILPQVDVIITSYEPMVQNFRASLDAGARDFLSKPYDLDTVETVIKNKDNPSFEPHHVSTLKPDPHPFVLREHSSNTYIKFWGTRGSHSVSGTNYLRFGGNTSCLEIRHMDHLVIIDAGTGLSNIGHELVKSGQFTQLELLIGHTHLDHMAGLPSFAPIHDPRFSVTIRAPINYYKNTKDLLRDMLTHAFFPVDLEEIKASLKFKELTSHTPFQIGSIQIDCLYTYHPGTTMGFKITIGDLIIGYITDNEVMMGYSGDPKLITEDHPLFIPYKSFVEFFKGVDVLIHEAQYTPKVYPEKIGWGHSSIYNAAVLVKYINPKTWVITHHDPEDSDEMIQKKFEMINEVCRYLEIPCGIHMAFDGLKISF